MIQTRRSATGICLAFLMAACSTGGNGSSGTGGRVESGGTTGSSSGGTTGSSSGGTTSDSTGGTSGDSTGGTTTTSSSQGGTTGTLTGGSTTTPTGGSTAGKGGATGAGGETATAGTTGTATGGRSAGASGQAGSTGSGGKTGGTTGSGGGATGSCVGKEWPTANPAAVGPFEVAADKDVGPLAGIANDPVYGEQKRFNVYRPKNLATSGYCHPILIWANGYRDNPEPNPPKCVLNSSSNQWCGQYLPMVEHLASHGFLVIASLSTATAEGDPLPTLAGLDWLLKQAEDSSSPYYHRLDTVNIGQLGHSYGGMSTCKSASDPRYKALATICGTNALTGVHTPMLFYCGGKDTTVKCDGVRNVFLTVKDQPAFFIDELASDHGWWVYQGASGVSLSMAAAWFRVHLMNDTANRKYFYGSSCTFCKDSRVKVEQNSLMAQ